MVRALVSLIPLLLVLIPTASLGERPLPPLRIERQGVLYLGGEIKGDGVVGQTHIFYQIPPTQRRATLDWLDSIRLPDALVKDGKQHPTYAEIGTGKSLFIYRRGSNVVNGAYYIDDNPADTVVHYSSTRAIDVPALRREYAELKAAPVAKLVQDSPLTPGAARPLPRYYLATIGRTLDLNTSMDSETADQLVRSLNKAGWWPTQLKATSNPYNGEGSPAIGPGNHWI